MMGGGAAPRPERTSLLEPGYGLGVEVRLVQPEEYEQVGQLVVSAYRAIPGGHLSSEYARELANVERRAREAEVLVAVDGDTEAPLGCVTFVPDASSPYAGAPGGRRGRDPYARRGPWRANAAARAGHFWRHAPDGPRSFGGRRSSCIPPRG